MSACVCKPDLCLGEGDPPNQCAHCATIDLELPCPIADVETSTPEKPPRQTVVVDVETNGLDWDLHQPVEVAWWNLDTDDRGCFVPVHDVHQVLFHADVGALRINRYVDRLADAEQDREGMQLARLAEQLAGNTIAGSNVRFDAHMLGKLMTETWHYRLLELGPYAAGVLRWSPERGVPGLFEVCEALGTDQEGDVHTASSGVTATGTCFLKLRELISIASNYPQRVILGSDQTTVEFTEGEVVVVADPAHEPPGFDWTQSLRPWNRKD